jgi:hypothetical protein
MGDVKAPRSNVTQHQEPRNETAHMNTIIVPHQPVTIERLERALAAVAYMMVRDGPVLVPIFEKLERELARMKSDQDAIGRAKQLLEAYRVAGVKVVA